MARWTYPVNAFNAGELSPTMHGRSDLQKYSSGAETIDNFLVQPEGGLIRRSGFRYVNEVKTSANATRILPFVFSTTQAYIIEMGNLYFRFYRNEGVILESATTITNVSRDNPAIVTASGHGLSNGQVVYIAGVVGMTEVNNRYFTVANVAGTQFELSGEDATGHTAYTSGGTVARVYELAHTYTTAELPNVNFAQSADVLYLAHTAHAPAKLERTGHTSWTLSDITFLDGPYLPENTTDTTLTPSAKTGSGITITASAVTGINDDTGFQDPQDVGRLIRIRGKAGGAIIWGNATITAVGSTTSVTADVNDDFAGTGAETEWRLGAWYSGNYPAAVSFAEGRLWWGGEPNAPGDVHSSKSGDFENMEPTTKGSSAAPVENATVADDSAVNYTIGSNQVNNILWMDTGRNLIMGTPGGCFALQASSTNEPVTPTNVNVPSPTAVGARATRPTRIGGHIVYIDRAGRRIRGLRYAFDQDSYVADDLNRLAKHMSTSGFTNIEYQLEPDSTAWCTRTDGYMAALAFVPEEDVFAWGRHQVGGTSAVVEEVAVIPSPNADHDQLWIVVSRTINGATVRYIEFLEENFDGGDVEDAFCVDSGLTYDGTATTTISGLRHLVGESVQILADGGPVANKTVSATGTITLDTAASKVQAGLAYTSNLKTLRLDVPHPFAETQGTLKRITNAIIRFRETAGGKYGRDADNLDPFAWRDLSDPMDTPPDLFTGDVKVGIELGSDRDAYLYIRQDLPLPMNILSITALGEGTDR